MAILGTPLKGSKLTQSQIMQRHLFILLLGSFSIFPQYFFQGGANNDLFTLRNIGNLICVVLKSSALFHKVILYYIAKHCIIVHNTLHYYPNITCFYITICLLKLQSRIYEGALAPQRYFYFAKYCADLNCALFHNTISHYFTQLCITMQNTLP